MSIPDSSAPPAGTLQSAFANIILGGIQQTCPLPTGVTATVNANNSVDVSWTAAANETGGYNWEIVSSGSAPGTNVFLSGTTPTGVTTFNATGLSQSTAYDVFVRNNCAGESSSFTAATTFRIPGPGDNCAAARPLAVELDCATATPFTLDFASSIDLGAAGSCDTTTGNIGSWFDLPQLLLVLL